MSTRTTITLSIILGLIILVSANGYKFYETGSTEQQPKYSQVKIFASSQSDFDRIQQAGLEIDHAESVEDGLITWLSEREIDMLKRSGVMYQVTIEDWMQYYNSRPVMTESERRMAIENSPSDVAITHSVYGSMGGYMTYSQVINKLDSMRIE